MELLKILVIERGQPGFLNNEAVNTVLLRPPYISINSFIVTVTKAVQSFHSAREHYYLKADPLASHRRKERISQFSIAHFWL